MSEAAYGAYVEADLMTPMRDEVRLAGNLYLPARDGVPVAGPWPTVLIRTPYDKEGLRRDGVGRRWAEHGYTCFIQDCQARSIRSRWSAIRPATALGAGTGSGWILPAATIHISTSTPTVRSCSVRASAW
jgi:hypothetical protein